MKSCEESRGEKNELRQEVDGKEEKAVSPFCHHGQYEITGPWMR